jgi:hypothetical protein
VRAHEDSREPAWYAERITELERHAADLQARRAIAEEYAGSLAQHAVERERYVVDLRAHFERARAWAEALEAKLRRFEAQLSLLPGTLPPVNAFATEEVVRCLYGALLHPAPPPEAEVVRWVARLRAGTPLRSLVDALRTTVETQHAGLAPVALAGAQGPASPGDSAP